MMPAKIMQAAIAMGANCVAQLLDLVDELFARHLFHVVIHVHRLQYRSRVQGRTNDVPRNPLLDILALAVRLRSPTGWWHLTLSRATRARRCRFRPRSSGSLSDFHLTCRSPRFIAHG